MKVDLDELERVAKAAQGLPCPRLIGWNFAAEFIGQSDPSTVLALIARIRELEVTAGECVRSFGTSDHHESIVDLRAIARKGVPR